jgi:hypothetical protein
MSTRYSYTANIITFLLTYLLTTWRRVLLQKLTGLQPAKKFPAFYGTRRFLTAFTSARHLSLAWASSIQSTPPHPTSWRSILILSFHQSLGLPSGHFPSGFPTKTWGTVIMSSLVQHYRQFGRTQYFHFQSTISPYLKDWNGMFPFERYVSTRLHGVTPQKTWIYGKEPSCYTSGWGGGGWWSAICLSGRGSLNGVIQRVRRDKYTVYVSIGKNAVFVPLKCCPR